MILSKSNLIISFIVFSAFNPTNPIANPTGNNGLLIDSSKTILYTSFTHTFSNPEKKDRFQISVFGKTIIGGQVIFIILNFKNEKIFTETFPATDLLGDEEDVLVTKKQKEDKIKERINSFFAVNKFFTPAIRKNEKFDANNYDRDLWNEFKSDPSVVGFGYQYGYEGYYKIAYSKIKKSVVKYFYSD